MAHERILVVEDDADIRELIRFNLERDGFVVTEAESVEQARTRLTMATPDLMVLDLMLPGEDGLTFCREIRADADRRKIPILMLTARGDESDVVAGLEVGADDYLAKPFSPKVLLARIRALLRRHAPTADTKSDVLRRGPVEIDTARHEVRLAGNPLSLTFSEFRFLEVLARRPGFVFSRYQIVDAVRGADYPVTDRSVDVQIVGLRRKLAPHGDLIETVRGVGYRFRILPPSPKAKP